MGFYHLSLGIQNFLHFIRNREIANDILHIVVVFECLDQSGDFTCGGFVKFHFGIGDLGDLCDLGFDASLFECRIQLVEVVLENR